MEYSKIFILKYSLSFFYVSKTLLGAKDAAMNKADTIPQK